MTSTGGKTTLYIALILCMAWGYSDWAHARKAPAWIHTMQQDYIIVSAEDTDVERAKTKAMDHVRVQIMNSIAQHVTSATQSHTTEVMENNQYTEFSQYTASVQTESVDYPFLSGISPSEVEEVYIEKLKKNKQTIYRYHVKYPYSPADLLERVEQFLAYESHLQQQMDEFIREDFTQMQSLEQMLQRKDQLHVFQATLPQSDSRRKQCDQLQLRYDALIRSVRMVVESISQQQLCIYFQFGDQIITSNKPPKLQSECLMEVAAKPVNNKWIFTYNFQGCYPDEPNRVTLSTHILGKKILQEAYIK